MINKTENWFKTVFNSQKLVLTYPFSTTDKRFAKNDIKIPRVDVLKGLGHFLLDNGHLPPSLNMYHTLSF